MANVTYLLGAGASANTIPIVTNMSDRFLAVIKELNQINARKSSPEIINNWPIELKNNIHILDLVIDNLVWLEKESRKHQTIDTLAKKYYLTDNSSLYRLKETLIQYFLIEQLLFIGIRGPNRDSFIKKKEYRYDSFFAALLGKSENGLKVKDNLKIVTWNYDQQIELALNSFDDKLVIKRIKEKHQIVPNHYTVGISENVNLDLNKFACLKLNGNAIWSPIPINGSDNRNCSLDYFGAEDVTSEYLLGVLLKERSEMRTINGFDHIGNSTQQMNFSWEDDEGFTQKYKGFNAHRNLLKDIAANTDCLVIIGYSFPVFNREVDKEFIEGLRTVKKVYIQDPNCEIIKEVLINGFNRINNLYKSDHNAIYLQKDTSQFLIPFELSEK